MPTIPYTKNTTWADGSGGGTPITAAKLNVLDNGVYEVSLAPAVRAYHNTTQSINSGSATILSFNSERFDQCAGASDTQHDNSTNNSRLTCRYAGVYQITVNLEWASTTSDNTVRLVEFLVNGATVIAQTKSFTGNAAATFQQNLTTIYSLAVNDYVEVRVTQTTGVALNIASSSNYSPEFMMVRVA